MKKYAHYNTNRSTTSLDTMLDEVIPWIQMAINEGKI